MDPEQYWFEIPTETWEEIRKRSLEQANFGVSHPDAVMTGYPVHFHDGKWYVEIRPQGESYNDFIERAQTMLPRQHGKSAAIQQVLTNEEMLAMMADAGKVRELVDAELAKAEERKRVEDEEKERLELRERLKWEQEDGS